MRTVTRPLTIAEARSFMDGEGWHVEMQDVGDFIKIRARKDPDKAFTGEVRQPYRLMAWQRAVMMVCQMDGFIYVSP